MHQGKPRVPSPGRQRKPVAVGSAIRLLGAAVDELTSLVEQEAAARGGPTAAARTWAHREVRDELQWRLSQSRSAAPETTSRALQTVFRVMTLALRAEDSHLVDTERTQCAEELENAWRAAFSAKADPVEKATFFVEQVEAAIDVCLRWNLHAADDRARIERGEATKASLDAARVETAVQIVKRRYEGVYLGRPFPVDAARVYILLASRPSKGGRGKRSTLTKGDALASALHALGIPFETDTLQRLVRRTRAVRKGRTR